ncbi:hypothetical protein GCM10007966_03720 [Legionella impletisoli]|uniref:Uncharacterized protein n=1 Tax=Legionella impletisoli TaxID=343510 RepID=A0A917JQ72_9GAMM|nr:hypothetical protein GCM10007966_03720 [Legionella impletisoli]
MKQRLEQEELAVRSKNDPSSSNILNTNALAQTLDTSAMSTLKHRVVNTDYLHLAILIVLIKTYLQQTN